jgi:4-hydroxy-3-polyprenylbenzoate decarboxylase
MEDAWLAKETEKIFLAPLKLVIQPEIEDLHMPDAGVAHNLAIVKINKSYPGQGKKVINSLFGAGQMMFTKYMIVVNGEIDIRNYKSLLPMSVKNVDVRSDLIFTTGPLMFWIILPTRSRRRENGH